MDSSDDVPKKPKARTPKKVLKKLDSIVSSIDQMATSVSQVNTSVNTCKSELDAKVEKVMDLVTSVKASFEKALSEGLEKSNIEVVSLKERVSTLEAENKTLRDEVDKWVQVKQTVSEVLATSKDIQGKMIGSEDEFVKKLLTSMTEYFQFQRGDDSTAAPSNQGGEGPSSQHSPIRTVDETLGFSDDEPPPTEEQRREQEKQDWAWANFLRDNPNADIEQYGYLDGKIVSKDLLEPSKVEQLQPMPPPFRARPLRDDQIRPWKSYEINFSDDMQLDLPMDPNAYFFDIWTPSVEGLPSAQYEEELRGKNRKFYKPRPSNQVGPKLRSKVWSLYRITAVGSLKKHTFQGQPWFEIDIRRANNDELTVSDMDFPDLNANDLYTIWDTLKKVTESMTSSRRSNMQTAGLRVRRFLESYIRDIFRHDAQLGPVIAGDAWLNLQPVDRFEGIDLLHSGVTQLPTLGVIYKTSDTKRKVFIRATQIHYYETDFLLRLVDTVKAKKKGDPKARIEFLDRVMWWLNVRQWGMFVFKQLHPEAEFPKSKLLP